MNYNHYLVIYINILNKSLILLNFFSNVIFNCISFINIKINIILLISKKKFESEII